MKETEKERGRKRAGKGVGGWNDWLLGCGAERVSYRDTDTEAEKKELTFKKEAGLKRASQKWVAAGTG